MIRWLFILIALPAALYTFPEEPHHTTAYISDPGEIDILLSYSSYSTNHFWNKNGKKLPTFNHFKSNSYPIYAEYAINSNNSLSFNGGYTTVHESLNGKSQALNDIELGWKYLICAPMTAAFTSQLIGIIPAGDKKSSIRYGKFGAEASLLYSDIFCFFERYGWYDIQIGYRWYQGFPSDQVLLNVSLGYGFGYRLQLIATGKLDYGLYNGKSNCNRNNVAFNPNYRLFKAKIECVFRVLSNVSITVGYFQHLWGRNVGTGGGFLGGTWIDF